MHPRHAIILAAGNGTRMGALTADRPKAMLEVAGIRSGSPATCCGEVRLS